MVKLMCQILSSCLRSRLIFHYRRRTWDDLCRGQWHYKDKEKGAAIIIRFCFSTHPAPSKFSSVPSSGNPHSTAGNILILFTICRLHVVYCSIIRRRLHLCDNQAKRQKIFFCNFLDHSFCVPTRERTEEVQWPMFWWTFTMGEPY